MSSEIRPRGLYIVIEGPEGAGKTTQVNLLEQTLRRQGNSVHIMREPDSQTDVTSRAIRRITRNPQYSMNSRTEALLYNAARSQTIDVIRKFQQNGIDCIVNRNFLSSLAVQYYGKENLDNYSALDEIIRFAVGDNEPDVLLILDAPANVLKERGKNRGKADRYGNLDIGFIERVRNGYLEEARHRAIPVIDATQEPELVMQEILTHISYARSGNPTHTPLSSPPIPELLPLLEIAQKITHPAGVKSQAEATPKTDDADTKNIDAGSSTNPDNELILSGTSALLSSEIMLSQQLALSYSDSAEPYDQKDSKGRYQFLLPKGLPKKTRDAYLTTMNKMFDNYAAIINRLTDFLVGHQPGTNHRQKAIQTAKGLLPLSSHSTIKISGKDEHIKNLIERLDASQSDEAHTAAARLLVQANDAIQNSFETIFAHQREQQKTICETLKKLTADFLPDKLDTEASVGCTLVDYYPKNELELAGDILYNYSNSSGKQLHAQVADLTYQQKEQIIAINNSVGTLSRAVYNWEIVSDFSTLLELQPQLGATFIQSQSITPRYGYDIPELIELAGLIDEYETGFSLSLELFSLLQEAGCEFEAQYATLLGHRLRWQMATNAPRVSRLIKHPPFPAVVALAKQMSEQLSAVHPLVADTLVMNEDRR